MTSIKKTKTNSQQNTAQVVKKRTFGGKLILVALLGVLIIVIVVGAAIFWEKELEPMVGVDLPDEVQETSESSSIIPYICEQDPESCDSAPLTFRGAENALQEQALEKAPSSSMTPLTEPNADPDETTTSSNQGAPVVKYPSEARSEVAEGGISQTFEFVSILRDLEDKLGVVDEILDEFDPLKHEVEMLRFIVLIQSTKDGSIPFELLVQSLAKSSDFNLQKLATDLPQQGRIIPFPQLSLQVVEKKAVKPTTARTNDAQAWWNEFLDWVSSIVEIKTPADVEEGQKVIAFKEAALSGQYAYAVTLYGKMDESKQQQYEPWLQQIQKQAALELLRLVFLQQLQEGV